MDPYSFSRLLCIYKYKCKTLFECRYYSLKLGIEIRFPKFCCLDVHGLEFWNYNPNTLIFDFQLEGVSANTEPHPFVLGEIG